MGQTKRTILTTHVFCFLMIFLFLLVQRYRNGFNLYFSYRDWHYAIQFTSHTLTALLNLLLGLISGSLIISFAAVIQAQNRFRNNVNKLLFFARSARLNFEQLAGAAPGRFPHAARRIVDAFDDFYQYYADLDYGWWNRKYQKYIDALYFAFFSLAASYNQAAPENADRMTNQASTDWQALNGQKYSELIHCYADLFSRWNKRQFASVLAIDEFVKQNSGNQGMESLRQILDKREKA